MLKGIKTQILIFGAVFAFCFVVLGNLDTKSRDKKNAPEQVSVPELKTTEEVFLIKIPIEVFYPEIEEEQRWVFIQI